MGEKRVKLETLDGLVHYSLAICAGLPILIFVGYFIFGQLGFLGISASIDILIVIIPSLILGPISLIIYFIQRDKLKFQFIRTAISIEELKPLIRAIVEKQKWTIRSFKENTFTIKTNPGFVNQVWGQHITVRLVNGGILVNSIFDTNKGSWLITFGNNQKNTNDIRRTIEAMTMEQNRNR